MPKLKPVEPTSPLNKTQQDALYQRYIETAAALAEGTDAGIIAPTASLFANEYYNPFVVILSDVLSWAYLPLSKLPREILLSIVQRLDQQAEENFQLKADAQRETPLRKEIFFGPHLVEKAFMDVDRSLLFTDDYLFYQTMAVMQLSVLMNDIEVLTEGERDHHYLGMRVCLERSTMSLILREQKQTSALKDLGKKGGKNRFVSLYGAAHEYTERRYNEIRAAKPQLSKLQIAKTIEAEATQQVAFRVMSPENRERTIYDWVRKL